MRTLDDMIRQEVIQNVSGLVATLANHGGHDNVPGLCDEAQDLCFSTPDYEEAAREAGLKFASDDAAYRHGCDAQTICEENDIEPQEREVFEHWIITDWLADKLEARGEKVARDFAGLTIWARTTTGQAIALDSVMVDIHEQARREYEELVGGTS